MAPPLEIPIATTKCDPSKDSPEETASATSTGVPAASRSRIEERLTSDGITSRLPPAKGARRHKFRLRCVAPGGAANPSQMRSPRLSNTQKSRRKDRKSVL